MSSGPSSQPASGSGITTQRSVLPDDIANQSQNAFRNQLTNSMNSTTGIASGAPQVQTSGPYDFGQTFSTGLDPNVQAQLSRGIANTAQMTQQNNENLARRLGGAGGANAALINSLQAQNNQGAALSGSTANLEAMNQQREQDVARQGILRDQYGIDINRLQQNNSANAQGFQNRIAAATAGNDLLTNLGKGIISTTPQIQGNFTVADLEKIQQNPGLLNPGYYGAGGLLSPAQINAINGGSYLPATGGPVSGVKQGVSNSRLTPSQQRLH